jgi:hypothetical protein
LNTVAFPENVSYYAVFTSGSASILFQSGGATGWLEVSLVAANDSSRQTAESTADGVGVDHRTF